MKITELKVNHIEKPMGYAISPLSFSWKVDEANQARKQKNTRVIVKKEDRLVFDSGIMEEANHLDFSPNIDLEPRSRYEYGIFVTADNGDKAQAFSWFETGKMGEVWQGKWITPNVNNDISPILEKTFTIKEMPKKARIYLCGLGVYEVYLNGKKVGNEYLAPGYHCYDFHLQVYTYNILEQLKKGCNIVQVMLGDGWFKGRLGFDGGFTNVYGDAYYLIAEIHLEGNDGADQVIITDESWQAKKSPIRFSNIYDGEIYDARLENINDDVGVTLKEPNNCGKLTERYSLPIVKKECLKPVELLYTSNKEWILDFGQNLTGWVVFDCHLPKGEKITLAACEILQNGCFYHDNMRTAKTEYTYISNGKKAHVRPHFTFYGFRYMKVEINQEIRKNDFVAYHIRSDINQTGFIETGNKKLNQLFFNALWSQKDNFLDIPTDCPQRDERLGWTGDAQIFSETACYNMYMPAFYRKYLWDMRAEQNILDGSVPNVVPRLKHGIVAEHGSSPWADAAVIIPWNIYLHYGSKTLLVETYWGMKSWVDAQRRKEESVGGYHLIKEGFHFADWLALDNTETGPFGATDPLYVASAYYYMNTKIVAQAANILGYSEEAEDYKKLADAILTDIHKTYFDKKGLCKCKTQTGLAIAIIFGLSQVPKEEGKELCQLVLDNQKHLNTGFIGTTMLCPALTETGSHELAVDLLLNEDYPSWLYSINLGATTVWERWNSVLEDGTMNPEGMNSLNHYCYGSIEAWMYKYVCGFYLIVDYHGFKKLKIAPHPDIRLGYTKGRIETVSGMYISEWEYNDDKKVRYHIEVPFDAEAVVVLPEGVYVLNGEKQNGLQFNLLSGVYDIQEL